MEKRTIKVGRYEFEILPLKDIPEHFFVWNIGRHNFELLTYIPMCEEGNIPYHINPDTLKCVQLPSESIAAKLLKMAGHGNPKREDACFYKEDVIRIVEEGE